jgi:tuftelin-interacting protein 11
MIERRAEENNLEFLPIPNRTYEGKQVYRFGRLTVYIDRNVVFMNENGQWIPVSLNTLVDRGR